MNNLLLLKLLKGAFLSKSIIKDEYYASQYRTKSDIKSANPSQATAGFTLLEVIVITVIIGILSAIAAPSWIAFTNRQQINKVNDVILSALRDTQTQAKKNKRSYSVWFRELSGQLEYAVVPTKKPDPTNGSNSDVVAADITGSIWKPLGGDMNVSSKQFVLRTNLAKDNEAGTTTTDFKTPKKITFDHMGTLPNAKFGTIAAGSSDPPGIKIVVAVPKPSEPTQPGDTKRCVIIQTLLGGMRTDKDKNCN